MERRISDYLLNPPNLCPSEVESGSNSSFLITYDKHCGRCKFKSRIFSLWPLLIASLLFLASLGLLAAAMLRTPNDMECAVQLSPYSPLLEAVEYEEVNWANDFEQPSIYRGYPNPGREKAWENLWRHLDGTVNIPEEKLASLNYSSDADYMRTPAKFGGGIEAAVEVFHQMHCLNMIRQYTYISSYPTPPPGFNVSPEILRTHIDHCIETLRRSLMCTGDATPMPIQADPDAPTGASATFSTHHKCRQWSKLTEWMEKNEVKDG